MYISFCQSAYIIHAFVFTAPAMSTMSCLFFAWFVRWEACVRKAVVFVGGVSINCSEQQPAFFNSSCSRFIFKRSFYDDVVQLYNCTDTGTDWKNSRFFIREIRFLYEWLLVYKSTSYSYTLINLCLLDTGYAALIDFRQIFCSKR